MHSKTLILMRHALTESHCFSGIDADRALTEKGQDDAAAMGAKIFSHYTPEVIYVSSATRTQQSIEKSAHLTSVEPVTTESLYLASAGDLLEIINQLPDTANTALFVGHNPGLYLITQHLTGKALTDFPPASVAILRFDIEHWASVIPAGAELHAFWTV